MENTTQQYLYHLIRVGELKKAADYTMQHIREHQAEEYFVLFYILFRIWEEEKQTQFADIFSSPIGREPDALLQHYLQCKLFLRRFEYDLPEDALQEAYEYFTLCRLSPHALYRIAILACTDKGKTFRTLAHVFEKNGNCEYAGIFRQAAKDA